MRSTPATTDGWRGLTGSDFAEPQLLAGLDHAIATGHLHGTIAVGYDGRAGAREIANLAADLLTCRGLSCVLADRPAPTPAIGRLVHDRPDLDGGVIVTASHNPPGFLGIKLRDTDGLGILTPMASTGDALVTELPNRPQPHPIIDALEHYATNVGCELIAATAEFDGNLLIDTAYGAAGALASLLPGIGWRRARPLPFFAGRTPDPARRPDADEHAAALLATTTEPDRTLIAMVDGDGDRLALYTARSGYIGSCEQAAALIDTGLPVRRIITTAASPHAVTVTAQRHTIAVDTVPVGFKHIVAAWKCDSAVASMGLEPNGALVFSPDAHGYFERDSLGALTTVLRRLPAVSDLDDAVADLRVRHPHPQLILTSSMPAAAAVSAIRSVLSADARRSDSHDAVVFDDGSTHVVIRASATEPGTRIYLEADPATADAVTGVTASG